MSFDIRSTTVVPSMRAFSTVSTKWLAPSSRTASMRPSRLPKYHWITPHVTPALRAISLVLDPR